MILLIDNYDSFTYNLFQVLSVLGSDVEVRRPDTVDLDLIRRLAPAGIVISPGPGRPPNAGMPAARLRRLSAEQPVLGVCLGHQCIGAAFGGRIIPARELMHGKVSSVHHRGDGVFAGLPSPFEAVRYHSLVVDRLSLPACLEVTAETEDGAIMGLRHRELATEGVQFHPESVLTLQGPPLLANFLRRCGEASFVAEGMLPATRTTAYPSE